MTKLSRYWQAAAALPLLAMWLLLAAGCGGGSGSSAGGGDPPAAPTATAGSITTSAGAAASGTLSATGSGNLTFTVVTQPASGTVSLADTNSETFTYTPNTGFTGTDSFTFTASNSGGTSNAATETITVTAPLPIPIGAYSAPASVGINVDRVQYYGTAQQFVNVIKQSYAWESVGPSGASGITPLDQLGELDANGWPEADAELTVMCCAVSDGLPGDPGSLYNINAGIYQLSFTGKAQVTADNGTVSNYQYNTPTNQSTAQVDYETNPSNPGGILILDFRNTQRTPSSPVGSGITNVQMIRPQFAPNGQKWWDTPTQEFTDPFLATLKGYSTLRFMDWLTTVNSQQINWSDRTPPNWGDGYHEIPYNDPYVAPANQNGWSYTGASWEDTIALANAVHEDMWINIPARATDDYVKSLAALIKSSLDPGLHVYVEYSNEVWNYGFWEYDEVTALGTQQAQSDPAFAADCTNANYNQCYVGERLVQISNDFASVYGQAAINTTIRPVYATQFGSTWDLGGTLIYIDTAFGPPSKYIYGVAQALYWGYTPPHLVGLLPATDALGNALTYTVTQPANGTVTLPRTGYNSEFSYLPTSGYSGTDSFTYTATDSVTKLVSASGTITLNVNPVASAQASAPVAFNATLAAYANTALVSSFPVGDSSGDMFSDVLTYTITQQPTHGSVTLSSATNGNFTYTPTTGYSGSDQFMFTVTDTLTQLTSAPATITITVGSAPPTQPAPPSVANLTLAAWSDPAANVTEPEILAGSETYLQQRIPVAAASFTPYTLYWGLHSFSYEGGPGWDANASLWAGDNGNGGLAVNTQADNDPLMGKEVTEGLNDSFENGVDMYMYYQDSGSYSKFGFYASTTDIFDVTAPKYAALHNYVGTQVTRTIGTSVSPTGATTVPGWQPVFMVEDGGPEAVSGRAGGYCPPGSGDCDVRGTATIHGEFAYLVNVSKAGNYTLSLTVSSGPPTPTQSASVLVNQVSAGTLNMSNDVNTQVTTAPIVVTLPQGLSLIEVQQATGEFNLYSINLAPD